jgi:hypothetical protein
MLTGTRLPANRSVRALLVGHSHSKTTAAPIPARALVA